MFTGQVMVAEKDFVRVAVEEWGTWVRVHEDKEERLHITGPMANILNILSQKLDFEYELVEPLDHVWGVPLPNGSWTGMLGMLQREEAEFALGPFGVTVSRETVCDFSVPVKTENSGILVIRPTLGSDIAGFLKPFPSSVWSLILLSLLIVFITFATSVWLEGMIFEKKLRNSISWSALWVVKALTQESTEGLPDTDGSRVVVATWLMASLVFMSSYSGILTAMLTVPKVDIPVDSMSDLITQNDLPWRLEAGSWLLQYFQDAPDNLRQNIYQRHSGNVPDCWAARKPISEGEFAVICDHTTMKKAMSWDFSTSGVCHLYISNEVITNFNLALAFKTKSKYKQDSDYWILKMKESGILDLWLEKEIVNTSYCLKPPSDDRSSQQIQPLDFKSFVGPLLVLGGGLALASATFTIEGITWSLQKGQKNPKVKSSLDTLVNESYPENSSIWATLASKF